jgi:hypothetical protein
LGEIPHSSFTLPGGKGVSESFANPYEARVTLCVTGIPKGSEKYRLYKRQRFDAHWVRPREFHR